MTTQVSTTGLTSDIAGCRTSSDGSVDTESGATLNFERNIGVATRLTTNVLVYEISKSCIVV